MKPESYRRLSELLQATLGLVLGEGKEYLIASRLTPVVDSHGFQSIDDLISALQRRDQDSLLSDVLDAITSDEAVFFREETVLSTLWTSVIPELMSRRADRSLRVWTAACSTGQEPYSVVMGAWENQPELRGWRFDVTATDASRSRLERARAAIYDRAAIDRGVSESRLRRYFVPSGSEFLLDPEVTRVVRFRHLNLLEPFSTLGTQDVILCRNVLMYYDPEVKRDIVERLAASLAPDGCLLLGSAENLDGITDALAPDELEGTTIFRRADASDFAAH